MIPDCGIIPIEKWGIFEDGAPYVIAGPCSAESESQVIQTALGLRKAGISVFRAGLWKPRTRPGCFEGVGEQGLEWLGRVRRETGMKVCTEVAGAKHVAAVADAGVDMVWIGARTTANPFLVEEIAGALEGSDMPVLVKNPVSPDIDLWIGAVERLQRHGIRKIAVVHRGFTTTSAIEYRNAPGWNVAVDFRSRFPEIPFFCDPSHMGGSRKFIREISQRAMDLGLDGLMIESHCKPECALSDALQQLEPEELADILSSLSIRVSDSDDSIYRKTVADFRDRIDYLDTSIVDLLAARMDICREIGRIKKDHNISILQTGRWEEALSLAVSEAVAKGLDAGFVKAVFNEIHNASIAEQNKILENS